MIAGKKLESLKGTQFEDGAAFTEGELYELQSACLCARDYWEAQKKEGHNALVRICDAEIERYAALREKITAILEAP